MINYLNEYGKRLSSIWEKYQYDHKVFPQLILDTLDRNKVKYQPSELIDTLVNADFIQYQTPSIFSEMNTRLYSDDKMYIELLQWYHLHTDLHDHNFSGVLVQIEGTSLDITYSFDEKEHVTDEFSTGSFAIQKIDLLDCKNKDYQIIEAGTVYKHAVSHVGLPTISLIIRTQPLAGFGQYIYFPHNIRVQYNMQMIDNKFIRLIKYLFNFNQSEFWQAIKKYIEINIVNYPNKVLLFLVLLYEFWDINGYQNGIRGILGQYKYGNDLFESLNSFCYYKNFSKAKKLILDNKERLHAACESLSFGNTYWFESINNHVKNFIK